MAQVYTVRSRVNQPERVFVSSNDDPTSASGAGFSQFQVNFDTPILDSKKTQLLRATIPNAVQNIPDYSLTFWYHRSTTQYFTPSDSTLCCVRLYPTGWTGNSTTWTPNRYFANGSDLVTQLNVAASTGGDLVAANPYWKVGDVSFSFSSTTNQISMTGLTSSYYYAIAGWNDAYVQAAQQGHGSAVNGGQTGGVYMTTPTGSQYVLQPYALGYTLNLRVGFAMSGRSLAPALLPQQANAKLAYANLTNLPAAQNAAIAADTFPNLVYTGAVYLYSNIVAGSTLGSNKTRSLLAVIPSNAAQLGVIQYTAATLTWITRLPDTIYNVTITMLDDASQPYTLPDSAVVNIELGFHYREDKEIFNPS